MKKINLLVGTTIGYLSAALFNAVFLVIKETNSVLKNWLKTTFGHHWTGHGIIVLLVFILATLVAITLYRGKEFTDKLSLRLSVATVLFTLLSAFIIAGFYASHL